MRRYCKKCGEKLPHVKAGWSSGRQLWQCPEGHRHTEPSGKKKIPTTTVAVRFDKKELAHLETLPGSTRSDKIRHAVKSTFPLITDEQKAASDTSPAECTELDMNLRNVTNHNRPAWPGKEN